MSVEGIGTLRPLPQKTEEEERHHLQKHLLLDPRPREEMNRMVLGCYA